MLGPISGQDWAPAVAGDDLGRAKHERDVPRRLAEGGPNHDIADALSIGLGPAGKHVENVLAKLDTDRPAAAVDYALRHGLLPVASAVAAELGCPPRSDPA